MKNIISVSRRTDIPAFYLDWFLDKLNKGYVKFRNPFKCDIHTVSLLPEDVICFVFWSKDYSKLIKHLSELSKRGYKFYFHFTINGYPQSIEQNVIDKEIAIAQLKKLSEITNTASVIWRYDPIIFSNITPPEYHLEMFGYLSNKMNGFVEKCYISFVNYYNKYLNRIVRELKYKKIYNYELINKYVFLQKLTKLAKQSNIKIFSCCNDKIIGNGIEKGRCVDINLIYNLVFDRTEKLLSIKKRPTRNNCGCYHSIDIGNYNTCLHDCTYCYAVNNITKTRMFFEKHNKGRDIL